MPVLTPLAAAVPAAAASSIGDTFATTVWSGSMLLAVPVAVIAGLVSFASPCVLPLVPGYVGYVSGMAAATTGDGGKVSGGTTTATRVAAPSRGRVLAGVGLFVAGFTLVFVALMFAAGAIGVHLVRWEDVITRVLGVVVILMGFAFLGALPFLQRERRLHVSPQAGLWGAPLLGIVFGLGWTPCLGPTLVAVQALSLAGVGGARRDPRRRVLPRAGRALPPHRAGAAELAAHARVPAPAPSRDHADRRRAAGAHRSGAGHGPVDDVDDVAAGLDRRFVTVV